MSLLSLHEQAPGLKVVGVACFPFPLLLFCSPGLLQCSYAQPLFLFFQPVFIPGQFCLLYSYVWPLSPQFCVSGEWKRKMESAREEFNTTVFVHMNYSAPGA